MSVKGHYHYECEEYCEDCLPVPENHLGVDYDDETSSQDTPANCYVCSKPLAYSLTDEGVQYVIEYILENMGRSDEELLDTGGHDDGYYKDSPYFSIVEDWALELNDGYSLEKKDEKIRDNYLARCRMLWKVYNGRIGEKVKEVCREFYKTGDPIAVKIAGAFDELCYDTTETPIRKAEAIANDFRKWAEEALLRLSQYATLSLWQKVKISRAAKEKLSADFQDEDYQHACIEVYVGMMSIEQQLDAAFGDDLEMQTEKLGFNPQTGKEKPSTQ